MAKRILVIVFCLALLVRLWGIKPGFPPYHPDEPQVYSRALLILQGKEEDLGYWGYPALVPQIHALAYTVFFIPLTLALKFISNPGLFFHPSFNIGNYFRTDIYGLNDINVLFWGRAVNAFLGALTVIASYFLGKKVFSQKVGVIAAILLAFNLKHVLASHFALVDVANGLFLVLVIISAITILENNQKRTYLISGILSGMAMSVKLSPFALAAPLVSELLKIFEERKIRFSKTFLQIGILVISFSATILLVNIFHLQHLDDLQKDFNTLNKRYAVGSNKILPFPYFNFFTESIPWYISIFSLLGLCILLVKKPKYAFVVMSPVVLFLFSLTFYSVGGVYSRNFIALIPIFIMFAAIALGEIFKRKYHLVAVMILMLILPTKRIIAVDRSYSQPWNMDQVKSGLKDYKGVKIAATPWFANYIDNKNVEFVNFGINNNFTRRELELLDVDYVLVDTDAFQHALVFWMSFRGREAIWGFSAEDVVNSTFAASATKDLLAFRIADIVKVPDAPETNFFLVKLPNLHKNFSGDRVFTEDFEDNPGWTIKGSLGENIPNTGHIAGKECLAGGCVKMGRIGSDDSFVSYLISAGTPRFFRYTSTPIEIQSGYVYHVSAIAWANEDVDESNKGGFFKVELYKDYENSLTDKPSELVFVSNRHKGQGQKRIPLDVYFYVPQGYTHMTISFQRDSNQPRNFYFDDLVVEKSKQKSDVVEYKKYPAEYVFIDSIF